MALIEEYENGNCRISVYDDCILGPEETRRIIAHVSRLVIGEELRRKLMQESVGGHGQGKEGDEQKPG